MSLAFAPTSPAVLSSSSKTKHVSISTRPHFAPSSFVAKRARVSAPPPNRPKVSAAPRMADASNPDDKPTAKGLAQLYGGSYLGTSIGLSLVSYVVLYVMIAAGVDVRGIANGFGELLANTPIGRPSVLDSISDTASTATLAYIAHKVTSPLRFPLTVAATPIVARAFSKKEPNEATGGDA